MLFFVVVDLIVQVFIERVIEGYRDYFLGSMGGYLCLVDFVDLEFAASLVLRERACGVFGLLLGDSG